MKFQKFKDVHYFQTSATSKESFWHAVNLWNERPNLINKRLIGCEVLAKFQLNDVALVGDVANNLQQNLLNEVPDLTSDNIKKYILTISKDNITFNCNCDKNSVVFFFKRFLSKSTNLKQHLHDTEISILDYINGHATFYNNFSNNHKTCGLGEKQRTYCYRLLFRQQNHLEQNSYKPEHSGLNSIVLSVDDESELNDLDWLKNKLAPKIVQWCDEGHDGSGSNDKSSGGSLKLVNINEYCTYYQKLKDIYGKAFVKIWPENTDPLKYVYEDVAIATYLLLLWQGKKKQNFVDLGCGNGLLVHILTCEGHNGIGVDVRSRKIWDFYPTGSANLQVKTIGPTSDDSCLFPDADWLIGNHSDELTPWVPVLAAMSSYHCKFFLLPCCSYELNGQKYQRQNSSKSQYMDYLDHVADLSVSCGFDVRFDKLRIPSTKRICIVGDIRNYPIGDHLKRVISVRSMMESACHVEDDIVGPVNEQVSSNENFIYNNFKTRSNEIKVRNCTQLDKNFVNELVASIANKILNGSSPNNGSCDSLKCDATSNRKLNWNEGVPLALSDLAKSLPEEYLKKLKKECGGLQTLVKNHHYIFRIDKGFVCFRKPVNINSSSHNVRKTTSFRTKHCWFFYNHPNKCPLSSDDCPYLHS